MPLVAGHTLSHYRITGPLGAGAMGEVYRAQDTRLGREVAIKVLPEHFASDEERLRRFEREAKTLATLNHPNVAQIFGVDQVGDTCFLVLELVPGETLEERLKRGPLPIDEALDVCKQIAEGLEAAHEAGVIHRDLKPANVRITPDGKVKVLDFGLAKPASESAKGSSADSVLSTEQGRLLGTPTYMAPEQARGKPIDKRVDVWAFGCVLYECLTGKRAFAAETLTDVLGAVLHARVDLSTLPAMTPPKVRDVIASCLEKDSHQRLRDVGDARRELAHAYDTPADAVVAQPARSPARWVLATTLLMALSAAGAWIFSRSDARRAGGGRALKVEIPGAGFWDMSASAISPDGTRVVFAPRGSPIDTIRLRALDSFESRVLSADLAYGKNPFFSLDGTRVTCFTDRSVVAVDATSGAMRPLVNSEDYGQGAWSSAGGVVLSRVHIAGDPWPGLVWVDERGGEPRAITTVQTGETMHGWPEVLPDGRTVLFTIVRTGSSSIAVGTTDGGAHRVLLPGAGRPRYSPTGHLLYGDSNDRLLAVRFDASKVELIGEPTVLAEKLKSLPQGGRAFDISHEGTLIYSTSDGASAALLKQRVMQVDRQGQSTLLVPEEAPWCEPRSSPDGHWLAMRRVGVPDCTLWLFDLRRKLLTRVSPEDEDLHRLDWSADSKSLLFEIDRKGFRRIGRIPIDGSGPIEVLTTGDYDFLSASALPDGSGLLCTTRKDAAGGDIVVWDFASNAEKPILVTPAKESEPRISPDGQWLAYESNVSGRTEVYLRSFTDSSSRVQVSTAGGGAPRWSRDGRELFYQLEDALLAVAVRNEPALDVSAPEVVFRGLNPRPGLNYDVAPDGQGFVVIEGEHREQAGSLHVIANWPRMLEAAAPR